MNYSKMTKIPVNSTKLNTTFLFFICLLFSTSIFSQEISSKNSGILNFESEVIDYGTINQNANGLRTFKFTNQGQSPIVITKVKTSCGCTIPTYSKKPILQGETGEIEIKYATSRVGVFSKTITIISNASEKNKVLKIKGNVITLK